MTGAVLSRDMTPEEFKVWYDRLKTIDPKLNHSTLARRLDVDQPRIGKWLKGKDRGGVAISGYLHLALERLEQLMLEEKRAKEDAPSSKRREHRTPRRTGSGDTE